jgi:hypothetical protein
MAVRGDGVPMPLDQLKHQMMIRGPVERDGELRAYGRRAGSAGRVAKLMYALAQSGSELNCDGDAMGR